MWVCHCNAFNDKALDAAIEKVRAQVGPEGKIRLAAVYREASGGRNPNCGTCLETVKAAIHKKIQAMGAFEDAAADTKPQDKPANVVPLVKGNGPSTGSGREKPGACACGNGACCPTGEMLWKAAALRKT